MKKHIFHLAWSPESLPTVDAISPLLDFLDTRLQDFNGRLLRGNVIRCLHIMWESVLNEIEAHVKSNASVNIFFLTFPACFSIPIFLSNLNSNCSNLLDIRNLQEQVKEAFCYQELF